MRVLPAVLSATFLLGSMFIPVLASAEDATGCAKFKWPIARELSAFAAPNLPAVAAGQPLPAGMGAVTLELQPQASVSFAKPPGRKPKVDPAFAGVFPMGPIATAGGYQVTLSDEAWIDVVQNGKEIRSSGFSGQPECPGVRKSVKFALQPGPATLQVSGAATDKLKVDILPAE